MKYEAFQAIAENYINGNLSTFKSQLKKLSKKNTLIFVEILSEYFEPVNVSKALKIVSKWNDID
jgi:hypothetical protein